MRNSYAGLKRFDLGEGQFPNKTGLWCEDDEHSGFQGTFGVRMTNKMEAYRCPGRFCVRMTNIQDLEKPTALICGF